jgi:hypothetical protein
MRAALPLAIAAALMAGGTFAQTPETTPAKKAGDTVSGITVMPVPKKACSSRDKDCIAIVVAELQRLYPEQLKQFCLGERTKAVRNQIVGDQLLDALNSNGAPTATAAPVSSVVKTACATDKK